MKTASLVSAVAAPAIVLACSSAKVPPVTPVAYRAPAPSHAPAPPKAKTPPSTQSRVVISDEIRAACGISDEDAYFAFDSAKIRQEDHGVLGKLATCFESGPLKGHVMRLVGHADPRGDDEYNMVLGGHRAESVRQYLEQHGLAKSRIETTSRGELDAKGYDEATWAKDRRVDIVLADSKANLGPHASRLSSSR